MTYLKKYIKLYWMPAAVFLLGTLAFALILWANNINDRQRTNFVLSDTIMDLRVLATVSHLWLEEALAIGDRPAAEGAFLQMDEAIAFSEAVLHGGVSEHGRNIVPVKDPGLRQQAEEISGLLRQLKAIGVQRYQEPNIGKIGSALDLRFNEVFRKFEDTSRAMELIVERGQIEGQEKARRLFLGMFILWSLLLALLTAMLSNRELKRKLAEVALQKAKDELEIRVEERTKEKIALQSEAMRAAHLASLGELAAGVAHEINNPMNGIINYARIILDKSAEGSRERDIAGRIIKEGNRVDNIVGNLLFFAREVKDERLPVSLHEVLSNTLTLTEAQLKKEGIVLDLKVPDNLPFVNAQAQQLEQVFLNLISNARYALNERFPEGETAKLIKITGEKISRGGSPYVRATFLDHGAGIPADLLDKVMDPFFSTKPPGKGTGLGLSISHGIIADHGGRIAIESREGQFTQVIVELPAMPA